VATGATPIAPGAGCNSGTASDKAPKITKENIKTVIDEEFVTKAELCTRQYAQACKAAGL
jgi:hypothetical protein